jgi:hypothetical protein
MFMWAKTFNALDHAAVLIGYNLMEQIHTSERLFTLNELLYVGMCMREHWSSWIAQETGKFRLPGFLDSEQKCVLTSKEEVFTGRVSLTSYSDTPVSLAHRIQHSPNQ